MRLAVALEVGEDAVGARFGQRDRRAPGAVGAERRVQVLEAATVAADDDQVHALLVRDLEVAHRAARVADGEAQRGRGAARERGGGEREAQAVLGDGEAADRVGGSWPAIAASPDRARPRRRRRHARAFVRAALRGALAVRPDRLAGGDGDAEHQREQRGEARELQWGAHAATAS